MAHFLFKLDLEAFLASGKGLYSKTHKVGVRSWFLSFKICQGTSNNLKEKNFYFPKLQNLEFQKSLS